MGYLHIGVLNIPMQCSAKPMDPPCVSVGQLACRGQVDKNTRVWVQDPFVKLVTLSKTLNHYCCCRSHT